MTIREEIVAGMVEILWGDAYAQHIEEHRCVEFAGVEITSIMPMPSLEAIAIAGKIAKQIEVLNGCGLVGLYHAACVADTDAHVKVAANRAGPMRFGNCLAWETMCSGVSWMDDHAKYEHKMPRHDGANFDLRIQCDADCKEKTEMKPCPSCSAYVEEGCDKCSNCSKELRWWNGKPKLVKKVAK